MKFFAAVFATGILLLPLTGTAQSTGINQRWVAHPDKSTVSFTALQEGAEFSGQFRKFSVGLELVPTEEGAGLLQIGARIQLASVDTQYKDRDDYLVQQDWFYVEMWPEAVFQSKTIRQLENNHFIADGTLSLRGINKAVEVALQLKLEDNAERGTLTGKATLNRLDFGVGQGEWATTEWVGDVVHVQFDLRILRAFE